MADAIRQLQRFNNALAVLREFDPELPSQVIQVFLALNIHPKAGQKTLADLTGVAQPSVSRATRRLGGGVEEYVVKGNKRGQPGLGLVEPYRDPGDGRTQLYRLTPKGERVMQRVLAALAPEEFAPPMGAVVVERV